MPGNSKSNRKKSKVKRAKRKETAAERHDREKKDAQHARILKQARAYMQFEKTRGKRGKRAAGLSGRSMADYAKKADCSPSTLHKFIQKLRDGLSTERVTVGRPLGYSPHLSPIEEVQLAETVDELNDWGINIGKHGVVELMHKILLAKANPEWDEDELAEYEADVQTTGGKDWFAGFKQRTGMSERKADPTERLRVLGANPSVVNSLFNDLQDACHKFGIDKRGQIWSVDEIGCCLYFLIAENGTKVVVKKGKRHVLACLPGERKWITMLSIIGNGGDKLPPVIIWHNMLVKAHRNELNDAYKILPEGTVIGQSESGWVNADLWNQVWEKHIVPHLNKQIREPTNTLSAYHIFTFDYPQQHKMHHSLVGRLREEHHVLLQTIGAHASHYSQACDGPHFRELRRHLRKNASEQWSSKTSLGQKLLKSARDYLGALEGVPSATPLCCARTSLCQC